MLDQVISLKNERKFFRAYEMAKKDLISCSPSEIIQYNFELSVICYYLGFLSEGYSYSDKLLLCTELSDEQKAIIITNIKYYVQKIEINKSVKIDFPTPFNYSASNPCIIQLDDFNYMINLRTVNYSIFDNGDYDVRDIKGHVKTRNFILYYDYLLNYKNKSYELINNAPIIIQMCGINGLEDIRLISKNEFFATSLEVNVHSVPQIVYGVFDDEGSINKIIPLSVKKDIICEKNWLPFINNGEIWIIYKYNPLTIYTLNRENGNLTLVKEKQIEGYDLSHWRGSAAPIEYREGWLFTIHQVEYNLPRRYYHRFVWVDKNFDNLKFSRLFFIEKPQIEFNLSIAHSAKGLLFTYSINDTDSSIGVIDYDVVSLMVGL